MLHASGVYYSYKVLGPTFEFRKDHMQLLAPLYPFLELILGAFWTKNGKNVSIIVKNVYSARVVEKKNMKIKSFLSTQEVQQILHHL